MRALLTSSLLILAACQSTPPSRDAVAPLLTVVHDQERAWNAGSIEDFMAAGYWRSDEMTFFSGGDWTRGYDTVLERYRLRYLEDGGEMGRLSFSDLEAQRLARDLGLVRGRWTLTFPTSGDSIGGLFTLVMERPRNSDPSKLPGDWRIIHDHTSLAE